MNNSRILINNLKILQGVNHNIVNIALILFGTLLLTISAKVQVPFWPVPMTMQTFVVFLIGSTYGVRLSFLTLCAYLLEGAIGLPVFAAGGGITYLMGPTAGYLYGMTIAAAVISYFANKGFSISYIKSFISIVLGSIIIFAFGVLYLGSIRELSVFQTGLAIAPFGLSAALLSPLVPKLLLKYDFTFMLSTAVLFQFSGLIILISTKSNSNYLTIGMGLFCLGISMAILPSSTLNQALTYVPDSLSGYISGLHNGAIQVGQLLSIALIGSLATANINKQLRKTFSSDWGNISDANYEALARGEDWLPSQLSNTEIETFRELARVGFSSGLSITVFTAMIILFTFVFFGLISKQKLSKSSI